MFNVDVFKHSFDNHVSLLEAIVIELAPQVGQDGVPLKRCDAPLFRLGVQSG